jgi:predicted SnoaL-like aldol condensation-catalyzing enzyme
MQDGNPSRIEEYIFAEHYIQHNKDVSDGLEPFKKLASTPNRSLNYTEIVLLVGQGNLVVTLCKANWKDSNLDQDYAQVDLFRIENRKVVEHWDNVECVPPKEEWVNSGKF